MNQDSFFCIVEGKNKIYGVFDGHGLNGHLISAYTMGAMADYIKNSKRFRDLKDNDWQDATNEQVEKAMRKCFRYAQDKAREQFKEFLQKKKKEKIREDMKRDGEELEIGELNVSIDSTEKEFVENISWDTESDEEDLEYDD